MGRRNSDLGRDPEGKMKPLPCITAMALWAAIGLVPASPLLAAEKDNYAAHPTYEDAVPLSWQSLVSKESFDGALAKTMRFNTALPPNVGLGMTEMVRIAASPCQ